MELTYCGHMTIAEVNNRDSIAKWAKYRSLENSLFLPSSLFIDGYEGDDFMPMKDDHLKENVSLRDPTVKRNWTSVEFL